MFDHIRMVLSLVYESLREGRGMDILHDQVWNHRIAIPAVKDLSQVTGAVDPPQEDDLRFLELKLDDPQFNDWTFITPSRRAKANRNLKRGWRGLGILQGSRVVADLWFVTPSTGKPVVHPDLAMLGIRCMERDAYAWDMLIDPAFRGRNLAVPMQKFLWATLKSEGFQKAYGYYWQTNIPALWMHRMLKYQELPKRWVSRFFSFKRAGWVKLDGKSAEATQAGN